MIYIFDLEGTLTNSTWRDRYAEARDWKAFHKAFTKDEPRKEMISILNDISLSPNSVVWIVTGKEELGRKDAAGWLKQHEVVYDNLFMRPQGNRQTSPEFKKKFILGEVQNKIALAVDDRQDVIAMYREHNIPALWVPQS